MISFNYFKKKLKDVSLSDMAAMIPMGCAAALKPFNAKKNQDVWLVCENENEARDNGYHFYKYMRTEHPEQPCIYAVSKKSKDWKKIRALGPAVDYGSIEHWVLYFTSKYNISSQKGGKPNAALCSFFELNGVFKPRNVFLQHGVTKDKNDWLMADRCRFDYFITAMASEDKFVRKAFGYDPEIIKYTGFPRFDNLHDNKIVKNRIIIMPTWRKWLRSRSERNEELGSDVKTSGFMESWMKLLNSDRMKELIEKYNLEIIFYPHRNMQSHMSEFAVKNPKITVASAETHDMQELMKSAETMITDYSSVYFDMFYMKKPVIFYQFDEEEFRSFHYEEGWFDYHNNPFGKSYKTAGEVLDALEELAATGYKVSGEFEEAHKREFQLYDRKNSERVYEFLVKE